MSLQLAHNERKRREEANVREKRRKTSLHEAGHAVVARALGLRVREVTVSRDGSSGRCWAHVTGRDSLDDIRRELSFDLAGQLAVHLEADKEVRDDALKSIIEREAILDWPSRTGMEGYRGSVAGLLGNELAAFRWLEDELPVIAADTEKLIVGEWDELVDLARRLMRSASGTVYLGDEWKQRSNRDTLTLVDRIKRNKKNLTRPTQAEVDECVRFVADKSSRAPDRSYVRATIAEWEEEYR